MSLVLCALALQQRNGGRVQMDFEELEAREDVYTTEVPMEAVGFVLGAKGATLRSLETRFKTFMFFDNDKKRDDCKRLYIIAIEKRGRDDALKEVEDVVRFKVTGQSSRGGRGGGGGYRGGGGRSPPRRRSYSRSRSPRRRSYSPRR